MPVQYLSPNPNNQIAPQVDATREFSAKISDPSRWIVKSGVPLFKAHERTDPATGQLIKVDLPKLYRIAANMQRLERQGGVPIRMTLGHTEPNKPETEQPPVGGYYKNARVAPFGPKGEPAVVGDEWLDPQYAPVRKNFPYRSAEYYDDAEQITGVALLTRDPYLDLGVVAYSRDDSLVCYTADSPPDRRLNYDRNGRRPILYHLVIGEVNPTQYGNWAGAARGAVEGGISGARMGANRGPYGAAIGGIGGAALGGYAGWQKPQNNYANQGTSMDNTQYASQWPWHSEHVPGHIGQHHDSAWRFADPQQPAPYAGNGGQTNYNPALLGMAGRALPGVMGAMGNQSNNARYGMTNPLSIGGNIGPVGGSIGIGGGSQKFSRGPQGRYAEEPPMGPGGPGGGSGGPPGDPLQQLQMLLMAAVEVLGQVTGGGGMGPGGPPPGAGGMGPGGPPPGPPQEPFPSDEEQYARYAMQQRYGQQGQQRHPAGRSGYGRASGRYENPAQPTPYGAQPQRTISGRPVGESLELARVTYQLQQQGQVIKMLAYERDQADTQSCVSEIQRLADMGYPVSEYEVGELKAKAPDQRGSYINHIITHYQKIGTEQMPLVMGDPTPAGPDPNLSRPTSKEEMEAALKLAASSPDDPMAYNKALDQIRYSRQAGTQYGQNRIAGLPSQTVNQSGEWVPGQAVPSVNGQH